MFCRIAHCPYCHQGDVYLDCQDAEVLFGIEGEREAPCPHLVVVDGTCRAWDYRPDGTSKIDWSSGFGWRHPLFFEMGSSDYLSDYLCEFSNTREGWEGAPAGRHHVIDVNIEEWRDLSPAEIRCARAALWAERRRLRRAGADDRSRGAPQYFARGIVVFAADPAALVRDMIAAAEQRTGQPASR
jgi:hypothetical protein